MTSIKEPKPGQIWKYRRPRRYDATELGEKFLITRIEYNKGKCYQMKDGTMGEYDDDRVYYNHIKGPSWCLGYWRNQDMKWIQDMYTFHGYTKKFTAKLVINRKLTEAAKRTENREDYEPEIYSITLLLCEF